MEVWTVIDTECAQTIGVFSTYEKAEECRNAAPPSLSGRIIDVADIDIDGPFVLDFKVV